MDALNLICAGQNRNKLKTVIKTDLNLIISTNVVTNRNVQNALPTLTKYCAQTFGDSFLQFALGSKYKRDKESRPFNTLTPFLRLTLLFGHLNDF